MRMLFAQIDSGGERDTGWRLDRYIWGRQISPIDSVKNIYLYLYLYVYMFMYSNA